MDKKIRKLLFYFAITKIILMILVCNDITPFAVDWRWCYILNVLILLIFSFILNGRLKKYNYIGIFIILFFYLLDNNYRNQLINDILPFWIILCIYMYYCYLFSVEFRVTILMIISLILPFILVLIPQINKHDFYTARWIHMRGLSAFIICGYIMLAYLFNWRIS